MTPHTRFLIGSGRIRHRQVALDIRTGAAERDEALDRLIALPPGETVRSLDELLMPVRRRSRHARSPI
jgi:hypothetical protein